MKKLTNAEGIGATSADQYTEVGTNQSSKSSQRRNLFKVLGASGGVAIVGSGWVKPAVSSVVLPAHAATSQVRGVVTVTFANASDSIMDLFIDKTYAAPVECMIPRTFCLDINGSNGITMVSIFESTVAPVGGTVTYTDGVEFTLNLVNVLVEGISHNFVIKATIIGNLISGTISCTAVGKSPSGDINFNGTIEEGLCSNLVTTL